ncbi:MAG TPA: class I SAM-dependent methyltransferase [Acidimicrobiales bacterium]
MEIHPAAAQGFAANADDYERTRPSYPPAAVAHLAATLGLGPDRTVADVAAGTGKLTRLLLGTGARVIAIEPVEEMRDHLADTSDGAEVLEGAAEDLPLADGAVDAVTVAQAFHWFDAPVAIGELARVLRAGGGVGIVFNERDNEVPWIKEVNRLLEVHRTTEPHHSSSGWREAFAADGRFTPIEDAAFDNPHELSPEEVIGRFRSLSFVGALDAGEQGALLADIAHLLASHPDTAGRTALVIPQRTVVSTCRLRT